MRFTPPPLTLPAELTWLLAAAFGPELPPLAGEPSRAAELAGRFDLAPRIVARHGAGTVASRLGGAAAELVLAHRRAVAVALAADATARRIARVAADRGLQIIFLKGRAMQQIAPGPPGWRPFTDLDVLLPGAGAAELSDLLLADGWAAADEPGNPQHLPPVQDPAGIAVDIHFRLRGVRAAVERWATAEELLAAGLCRPAGLAAGSWVPGPTLLAAHLAVHALEQHGHRPASYPLLRAVADLHDLTTAAGDAVDATEVLRLVHGELKEAELRALFALGPILAAGRVPTLGSDDEVLLRHIAAGALDDGYRRGLALGHTAGRLRQARRDGQLMRYIARKLKPPADPSAADSGAPGATRRRVLRPIHLAARFTSAAAARLRRALNR